MSTTRQSVRFGLLLIVITTLLLLLGTIMDGPISESQSFGIPSIDPADDGYRNDEDEYLNRRYFKLSTDVVSYDTRETDSEEQTAAGSGSVRTRSHVREFKKSGCCPLFGCVVRQKKQTANAHHFHWRLDCPPTLCQFYSG
jgi:hypothetical protein